MTEIKCECGANQWQAEIVPRLDEPESFFRLCCIKCARKATIVHHIESEDPDTRIDVVGFAVSEEASGK